MAHTDAEYMTAFVSLAQKDLDAKGGSIHEFGSKAAIAMTKTSCIIVGAKSFANEYDGHTLQGLLAQVEEMRGSEADAAFCDRGFRGRKRVGKTTIQLPEVPSGNATDYEKRKARHNFGRRSAIEPVIGHLKNDFRLARNYLKGTIGDSINLLMAAAAFNCKKWMNIVAERLFFVLFTLWDMVCPNDEYKTGNA
jgi:IS5 family transposase